MWDLMQVEVIQLWLGTFPQRPETCFRRGSSDLLTSLVRWKSSVNVPFCMLSRGKLCSHQTSLSRVVVTNVKMSINWVMSQNNCQPHARTFYSHYRCKIAFWKFQVAPRYSSGIGNAGRKKPQKPKWWFCTPRDLRNRVCYLYRPVCFLGLL